MEYTLDQEVVFDSIHAESLNMGKSMPLGAAIVFVQLHATLRTPFEIRDFQTGESVLELKETPQGLEYFGEPWLTDKVLPLINTAVGKLACVIEIRPDLVEKLQVVVGPSLPRPF